MAKGFEIDEMKNKLDKLKTPKTIVDIIRKSDNPNKYLHHILRHEKYCA